MKPKVSLIASSVRHKLYPDFFGSLEGTSVDYEVVFVGNLYKNKDGMFSDDGYINSQEIQDMKYITTADIKPAQCYEIARRNATGETVLWCADDAEFPNDVVGKAYTYWKSQDNYKLILSIQTKESGYNLPEGKLYPMYMHTLIANDITTPLMAPLALMSRKFLEELGGFDCRYVCGQYENDVVMNAYRTGGKVEVFGDKDCFIDLDHLGKSIRIGECKDETGFLERPFASGYRVDRCVLLHTWCGFNYRPRVYIDKRDKQFCLEPFFLQEGRLTGKDIKPQRVDEFQPYEDKDILTKSQSNRGKWK